MRWTLGRTCAAVAVLLTLACTPRLRTARYWPPTLGEPKPKSLPNPQCNDWRNYLPDTAHPEYLPLRTLRVNFHVMSSRDSSHNFRPAEARTFLRGMLDAANTQLDTNVRSWRSPDGTAVLPKNYRYLLWPQPVPGDDAFYFHYDDSLYYFIPNGKYQNNYDRRVIDKYAVGKDSIINIFIMVHPDDSIRSPTYRAGSQGIALGTSLKMVGMYSLGWSPDRQSGSLNHEVGHILGLSHAWGEDGCPDTEKHPNKCWEWTPEGPCNSQATNNVMDYNAYTIALTPCQIGRIHQHLSNEKHRARRCLVPTWCVRDPARDMVIRDSVVWAGGRDLEGNLTIAPGGSLRLSCRLSLPAGARLTVQPGGTLWLDGARLHNACGKTWEGIFVEKRGKQRGAVQVLKPATLENCQGAKNLKIKP
jgi:hypothetical protein